MPWQLLTTVHRSPWPACLLLAIGASGCGGAMRGESPAPPAQAPEATSEDADSEALEESEGAGEPSSLQPGATAPAAAAPPSSTGKKERGSVNGPGDLGRAESELARAQQRLDALYAAPTPGETPADAEGEAAGGAGRPRKPATRPGAPRCGVACRAFESLERAASAICRIAGESSDRCHRALAVVQDNRSRVAACSCAAKADD